MDAELFHTACLIIADELQIKPDNLTSDTTFAQLQMSLDDYHRIYERACGELGISLPKVVNSMPIYSYGASPAAMGSLQWLSAFSAKASTVLARFDVTEDKETIGSFVETLAKGEYVASGLVFEPNYPARSKASAFGWTAMQFVLLLVVIPFGYALWPCNPFVRECTGNVWTRAAGVAAYSGPIWGLLLARKMVPGLWAMVRHARNQRSGQQ
jgi:hypothetical protein